MVLVLTRLDSFRTKVADQKDFESRFPSYDGRCVNSGVALSRVFV